MGIECDVQLTGDDRALVFHDFDLERLTGEGGAVRERDLADLSRLRLSVGSEHPQSLAEMLEQVAGRAPVLVEMKSRKDWPFTRLCEAVASDIAGYDGPLAIMSFDPRIPRWFADNVPDVLRGLVVTEEGHRGLRGKLRRELAFSHARADFLAYDVRDLPSGFAARKRKADVPVLTWTVRSPELREVAQMHADSPIAESAGVV